MWNNAQCVQTQCMCATRSSKSTLLLVFCFVVCLLTYASFHFSHEVCVYPSQAVVQICVQTQCVYASRPLKSRCNSSLVSCLLSCLLLYVSFQFYLFVILSLDFIDIYRDHCFHVVISVAIFLYWIYIVYTSIVTIVDNKFTFMTITLLQHGYCTFCHHSS